MLPKPSFPRILRIPRSDDPASFTLLHVDRSGNDLSIAATEGETPYTGTERDLVRQNQLCKLRAKNYQGSDEEWQRIVSYVFGVQPDTTTEIDTLSGIESSASIVGQDDEDRELIITIRKRIQGITQRLGSISLKQDDEQAIELFNWTGMAVERADMVEDQLTSLRDRYRAAEVTINRLNKQLEDFIAAKNQHEEQLMVEFVQLLNEKKLKIRNQQRLLASANVDPQKLSDLQAAAFGRRRTPASKSRDSKRSARQMDPNQSDSEDEFERMDVDKPQRGRDLLEPDGTDDDQQSTPQPLEENEDTATDDESSSPAAEQEQDDRDKESDVKRLSERPKMKQPSNPPPRRELPFSRRPPAKKDSPGKSSAQQNADEETAGETDDDEL
ncbi:hypothetical protein BDV59DRAFT_200979 [Aspergillus ambiguus]|uniref:uncharacterized protein n=1 Tax=Aspergillus ambiguus TaxID=176160 RepID=UPI003CCD0559